MIFKLVNTYWRQRINLFHSKTTALTFHRLLTRTYWKTNPDSFVKRSAVHFQSSSPSRFWKANVHIAPYKEWCHPNQPLLSLKNIHPLLLFHVVLYFWTVSIASISKHAFVTSLTSRKHNANVCAKNPKKWLSKTWKFVTWRIRMYKNIYYNE